MKCIIDISARYRVKDADSDTVVRAGTGQLQVNTSLSIPGITALYGPSGAGKTTLLRLIQGLESPLAGKITFGGIDLIGSGKAMSPEKRPIATVFQDTRVFGFKTVRSCLAAATRFTRHTLSPFSKAAPDWPKNYPENQTWFDLENMVDKPVMALSGGERQRLAIYIALLKKPRLLLLDEAFSAQDYLHKQRLWLYLRRLVQRNNLAILMVTHQIDDIIKMADDIILMDKGQIKDSGPVHRILPKLGHGAFSGLADLSSLAILVKRQQGWYIDDQKVIVEFDPSARHKDYINPDDQVPDSKESIMRVRVLASDVSLALEKPAGTSIQNILKARVIGLSFKQEGFFVDVKTRLSLSDDYEKPRLPKHSPYEGQEIIARISQSAFRSMNLKQMQSVWLLIKAFNIYQ